MILGTKARYAVMALVDMAGRQTDMPVKLVDLSKQQDIPLPYLEQIFAQLRRAGVVQSIRGPKGGYALASDASSIHISTVVEAVDESIKMTRCGHGGEKQQGCLASNAQCMTHHLWEGLGNHIYDYLNGISLRDVCQKNNAGKVVAFDMKQAGYDS